MRIAQVAPLIESVPPQFYGGTERVVSALTEELVSRGHDVTLFASGDSVTSANLAPCSKRSLRLDGTVRDSVALTTIELARVFDRQEEFDVIHNHVDYFAFPFARQNRTPMITTTHGRLDLPEIRNVYEYFAEAPLVSDPGVNPLNEHHPCQGSGGRSASFAPVTLSTHESRQRAA
jgi:glycosyltransferase involved in cell wall biosynthesis